ncbi:MAG: HD domain-containing phosphohydrolase [Nitrospirota bacterium]
MVTQCQKQGVNILLVDDDRLVLSALADILSQLEVKINKAASGQEALQYLKYQDVAVILLDVRMPKMDGFELAVRIREKKHLEHIPIIFVTGTAFEVEQILKGYSLGAVDYVFKPVIPEVLIAKVQTFIDLYEMRINVELQAKKLARSNIVLKDEIIKRKQSQEELKQEYTRLQKEIIERKKVEEEVFRLNRIYEVLSLGNEAISHGTDVPILLQAICKIMVESGGYRLVWIGFAQDDENKSVLPVVYFGLEDGYLDAVPLTWADNENGQSPMGTAIRTGKPEICRELGTDPKFAPWQQESAKRGYASIIALPLKSSSRILGTINICAADSNAFDNEEIKLLSRLADDTTYGITSIYACQERDKAQRELEISFKKLQRVLEETVDSLASALEKRDAYTAGHEYRVTKLACAISNEMKLSDDTIEGIRIAGLLHDIGKIGVPLEILSKPAKLSELEFGLVKTHAQLGDDITKSIEFPWPVASAIRHHHEKMNGSGYPDGLSGDNIPLAARILCVADVVEAMSSHRPYRPALGIDAALNEISKNKDILYDPTVVDACISLFEEKRFEFRGKS